MRAVVRKDDTLARIGGDEFALLIPRMKSIEGTTRVAEKIIGALSLPFMVDEGTAKIGVSVGIAIYPQHGTDAATLTANADRALYRAKAEGRNVWRFAETDVADA
jgi:diguanylate cyclase (GGDEF)-like protein